VSSRWRYVLHSGCIGIRCEHWPIDPDDVVIASSQISWNTVYGCRVYALAILYYFLRDWLSDRSLSYGIWVCGCSEYWDYWTMLLALPSRGMIDRYWRFEG
jgi:hypothetical protein